MNLFGKPASLTERERQLARLLVAVEEAQLVARTLCSAGDGNTDVKLLFGRLEAVRLEVEQLHSGNGMGPFEEIDPKWTGLVPWRLVPEC